MNEIFTGGYYILRENTCLICKKTFRALSPLEVVCSSKCSAKLKRIMWFVNKNESYKSWLLNQTDLKKDNKDRKSDEGLPILVE